MTTKSIYKPKISIPKKERKEGRKTKDKEGGDKYSFS